MTQGTTPNPYFLRGYTGHCPGYRDRCGGSFSSLSHKLFINPCTNHSTNIVLTNLEGEGDAKPDPKKLDVLKKRERLRDVKYRYPMLVGYDGHIPRIVNQCGDRFAIEALEAVTNFTLMQELKRCQAQHLKRKDVPYSGEGHFNTSLSDRIAKKDMFRKPLLKVSPRVQSVPKGTCELPVVKKHYNKETRPLFLECGDPRKYIVAGYAGTIPFLHSHFGHSNSVVTHGALCEYLEKRRRFGYGEWCPQDGLAKCPLPLTAYDDRSCPVQIDYSIYDSTDGMLPTYAGHVPGYRYACGGRYSKLSANAKNWLEIHRGDTIDPTPARIRL